MNIIEFTEILNDPKSIDRAQTSEMYNILASFPYFQAAHFLHLNGLKKQSSFKYNLALKKTAAYTTDRAVLFDYITSNDFDFQNLNKFSEVPRQEEKSTTQENTTTFSIIKPEGTVVTLVEEVQENVEQSSLPIGKPLQFDTNEKHSFNEWLQLTSFKPIQREENDFYISEIPKKESKKVSKHFDLIDQFIAKNPKIPKVDSFTPSNISTESVIENQNLMTETLAHVYLEQKKYKKAITAFQVLSLKYPEKSSFFANQIEEIKKLQ